MRLFAFQNLPLPGSEVFVEFCDAPKDGNSRKGFHDFKHLLDLRLQVDERHLLSLLLHKLAGSGEDPKAGAADEIQFREIKDQVLDLRIERRGELRFELRGGGGVEAAAKFHSQRGGLALDFDV